jgi:hypothetical protein
MNQAEAGWTGTEPLQSRRHDLREPSQLPAFLRVIHAALPRAPVGTIASHALIVEVAPGLWIERVIDLALKSVPEVEPGLLFVERQFGILEVHSYDLEEVRRAGDAILQGIDAVSTDQLRPRVLFADAIEDIGDQHAVIINRTRQASMVMPGETMLVLEVVPALFAAVAANEAERCVPENTLVDVQMIGAAGRVYISGSSDSVARAQREITRILDQIEGREH